MKYDVVHHLVYDKLKAKLKVPRPQDIHIIQLDNGGCHQALDLSLPENIILLFQPPHCPEVNPIREVVGRNQKISQVGVVY